MLKTKGRIMYINREYIEDIPYMTITLAVPFTAEKRALWQKVWKDGNYVSLVCEEEDEENANT